MKKTFEEGQRVGCAVSENGTLTDKFHYNGEYDEGPAFGKVVDVISATKVKVLWDDDCYNDHCQAFSKTTGKLLKSLPVAKEMDTKLLLTEEEAKAKHSELEKEYEVVAKEIRAKLAEAGKLIKEANKMAKKAGAESLNEMYDAIAPLEDAMDACGWRTSSWNC